MTPEIIIAIGTAVSATVAALVGGKRGGENSLNGFKEEVRQNFLGIHAKLDTLTKTDGAHEARLASIERIVERRAANEPVLEERRG